MRKCQNSQNMKQQQKEAALSIMEALQKHPATASYFDSKSEEDPIIFTLVTNKLNTDSYSSVKEWIKEIEEFLNKESELVEENILNLYINKLFHQLLLEAGLDDMEKWSNRVYKLRNRLRIISTAPPKKLKPSTKQIWVSEKDISSFMKALSMMTSDQDRAVVFGILSENERIKDLGSKDVSIDVFSLKHSTIDALKQYMKRSFAKKGIEYPSE